MKKNTPKITLKKLWITYFKLTFTSKINRLPRSYFWLFQIFKFVEIYIIAGCFVWGSNLMKDRIQFLAVILFMVGFLTVCLLIISNLAINFARLHDSDHSAWNLLWGCLPYVGGIIVWVLLGFYGSTQGENRYGKPFDFDKLETLPPDEDSSDDAFELEEYDINKSKRPDEKAASLHPNSQASKRETTSRKSKEPDFDQEEYLGLISFAYGKIKQTNIFELWRKEQFDCQFGKCAICNKPMELRAAQAEHVKPSHEKGTNYSDNLALVHKKCAGPKAAKTGFEKPDWIRKNKYAADLNDKVYEITEEIRAEYPTKFPDELFEKPGK